MAKTTVGDLEIELLPDAERLKLFVNITSKSAAHYTAEQLEKAILSVQALANVDRLVLSEMAAELSAGKKIEKRRIAKGRAPEVGADGKLLLLVKKFSESGGSLADEKGALKLSGFHLFDNIKLQQVIGRLYPPKPGIAGQDVFGKEIPAAAGKPARIKLDKSVELRPAKGDQSYQEIVALVAGYASDKGEILKICEELVIKGDLDLRYGSLNFIGSIEVRGSVAPMLNVRAVKDIKVLGEVRNARLVAGGNIEIKNFVFGGEHGAIVANGNFTADVAHEAFIQAQSITINKEARNCQMTTHTLINMQKATLLGGRCCVGKGLDVRIIGSQAESRTEVEFSLDVAASAELSKLGGEIESHDRAINLLELHLGAVVRDEQELKKLSKIHQKRLRPLLDKYHAVTASRQQLHERKQRLLEGVKLPQDTRINLRATAFPGLALILLDKQVVVSQKLEGPVSLKIDPEKFELMVEKLEEFSVEQSKEGDENDKKA